MKNLGVKEGDFRLISRDGFGIHRQLSAVDYLGAMRLPPERTYLFSGERRARIGARGENASSIFATETGRGGKDLAGKICSWFAKAGIASEFEAKPLSDRHYELRVRHPVTGESENIADVGFGSSQVFPVLVGGYRLRRGSLFVVEEPEIHLHPKAQATLGDFFLDLYKSGVQSVVETHSEYLILRVQQHIAAGHVKPEDIVFYYVHATEKQGKQIKELRVDRKGNFIDKWPQGFFPERLEEAKKLAAIRFAQKGEVSGNV